MTKNRSRFSADYKFRVALEAAKGQATMWGNSIVGFGSYLYKYASSRVSKSGLISATAAQLPSAIAMADLTLENRDNLFNTVLPGHRHPSAYSLTGW